MLNECCCVVVAFIVLSVDYVFLWVGTPRPMYTRDNVPQSKCTPEPMYPRASVPQSRCTPEQMYSRAMIPQGQCTQSNCTPEQMYPRATNPTKPRAPHQGPSKPGGATKDAQPTLPPSQTLPHAEATAPGREEDTEALQSRTATDLILYLVRPRRPIHGQPRPQPTKPTRIAQNSSLAET